MKRTIHFSELLPLVVLIDAWQVLQEGDGFEVIFWKLLTGTEYESVRVFAGLKIICQNVEYLRRRLPVIFDVHPTTHKGGFDQEICHR